MFEDLRKKIIMFNIVIVLLFISIVISTNDEELSVHVPSLIVVTVLSLALVITSSRVNSDR
ncbi:MAG: hypothetical protein N3D82_05530 [Ignisphaera sp.]|nr:hypothetical protein [Ignisphaera sp.]MCX8168466.1 hypothetical protein [Ignisphaera sp.]MDW8085094.1 hypothetical protein [Ignisphaera sp.]